MTEVKNFHDTFELVGAAGIEPTTSLEFNQGALTAELYAYSFVFHLKPTVSIGSDVVQGPSSTRTAAFSTRKLAS